MSAFGRGLQIILALVIALSIMIVLPAIIFGVGERSQIIFLYLSYFCFFLSAVWRVLRYGKLTKLSEDQQVKQLSGRIALAVQILGFLAVHWLAIYNFSLFKNGGNFAIDTALTVVSALLITTAIIINQLAVRTLGRFFDRVTIKANHRLITNGIYRVVQHPIYLSYILLFTGFCLMLQSFISLGLLMIVCTIWFSNRITFEERMLAQQFGEAYKTYQRKTKRLFPLIY